MTDEINIKKYGENGILEQNDLIIKEHRSNLYVNGEFYISLMCLPQHLDVLAVGFLYSEGVISSYADVVKIDLTCIDDILITVRNVPNDANPGKRAIVSGFARGSVNLPFLDKNLPMMNSLLKISPDEIIKMAAFFNKQSDLFQETGAVHSCSMNLPDGVNLFYEDIGRHNAADKIIGRALIDGLCAANGIFLTSGRISSEILIKVASLGVPILLSTSAPTNMAVEIARKLNMTLIGFARDDRFNIYSGDCRIA